MAERNKTLNEAQRNLANLLNRIFDETTEFKKKFVGVDFLKDEKGALVLGKDGKPVEVFFHFDPSVLDPENVDEFFRDFPNLERPLKFVISNTGLGGTQRVRMLRKLGEIRKIRARPNSKINNQTRRLVRAKLANLVNAIDGAISRTAMVRDNSTVKLANQMVQNVSLQDVTRSSLDVKPDAGVPSAPSPPKSDDEDEFAKW